MVRAVLLVADVLEPLDHFAIERFLNGDVRHRGPGRRAVPVPLVRRDPDDVAGSDLLDRTTLVLHEAEAGEHYERLTKRMRVPRRAGAWLKGDGGAGNAPRHGCGEERIDADGAGEPVGRSLARGLRARARDVHGSASR